MSVLQEATTAPVVSSAELRLTEADLVSIWEGQRFPPEALRAGDGRALRVIYRGRRTGGRGPISGTP